MQTLGVIGTGHLATYFVAALRRGGFTGEIVLSPRNAARAKILAEQRKCRIASSNADVLERSEVVLLSVRPHDARTAVAGLHWRAEHVVLSAMAGIGLAELREMLPGAGAIHMIMPLSYLEVAPGPFPLCPPSAALMGLLSHAGQVVPIADEKAYEASLIASCASTWIYDLAEVMATELGRYGLEPGAARTLALGGIAGSAAYASARPEEGLADISRSIATEGTYTKLGLDLMKSRGFDQPWREAMAAIAAKLD
ncbi:MAG: NAD(P)-binding domain-containing protein [Hyphomicrobiaceae bacterium]